METEPANRAALLGLLVCKPRWGLSWRGWLAVLATLLATAGLVLTNIHPFLATTNRLATPVLVVEGWINAYALRGAAEEFRTHGYDRVFSTGTPVIGLGGYVNDFQTSASVGADGLKAAGVPADRVQMVPSRVSGRDRTYSSAVALREWFRREQFPVTGINVLTEDAHARRTRLLYQMAFGRDVEVGVISIPNPDYDPRRWWRYSQGVREVFSESLAYLYAKFLFFPPGD
jgi:hypothetical protein